MGSIKRIYIIHGWTYSLDKWQKLCNLLKDKGFDPVQLRVPGLTIPTDKTWDINEYVQWLDNQLEHEEDVTVIGHSNGGRIAMAYIQKHPDKIRKLILIDSAGVLHDELSSRIKLSVVMFISKIGKVFKVIPGFRKLFYRIIGARDYLNAPPHMKKTMQNMLEANKIIDPTIINIPTTIIWGREDAQTPLSDGERLANDIVNSNFHVIDGARHAPFYTHPEAVLAIIEEDFR